MPSTTGHPPNLYFVYFLPLQRFLQNKNCEIKYRTIGEGMQKASILATY